MSHISLRTINEEHATLGILFMMGMAVFFVRLFLNKI